MNLKLLCCAVLIMCIAKTSLGQQNSSWAKWSWLLGDWKGEGSGEPGKGGGTFNFKNELDDKILVRKSHSEYPTSGNKPATIHDDIMIVYPDFSGNPGRAIYFDNEGHTINYSIAYSDKTIVLLSDKIPNIPIFRLTYSMIDEKTTNTKFEMSQDGEKSMMYIEGRNARVK